MPKAKSTNLSIRMDLDLKREAEELFGQLGMSLTTAFHIFVRQSLLAQGLPFSVKLSMESPGKYDKSHQEDDVKEKRKESRSKK